MKVTVAKTELVEILCSLELHRSFHDNHKAFLQQCYTPGSHPFLSDVRLIMLVDLDHLMKRLVKHLSTKGFFDLNAKAWRDVIDKELVPGFTSQWYLRDGQNVANARIFFKVEVENALQELNYVKEAQFCKVFREFYEAADSKGLSDNERKLRIQQFLHYLHDVSSTSCVLVQLFKLNLHRQSVFCIMSFLEHPFLA
jgi:hypothetical protein